MPGGGDFPDWRDGDEADLRAWIDAVARPSGAGGAVLFGPGAADAARAGSEYRVEVLTARAGHAWAAGWRRVGAAELFLYQLGGSATAHLRRRADGAESALPLAPQAMLAVRGDDFDVRVDVDDGPDAALLLVSNKNA